MFGANVGTAVSSLFASQKQSVTSQRIAFSFFFVRLLTSLLLLPFLTQFVSLSSFLSHHIGSPQIEIERVREGGEGRELAVGFTLFNVLVGVVWVTAMEHVWGYVCAVVGGDRERKERREE